MRGFAKTFVWIVYLAYCLGGGDKLAVVVVDQCFFLGVECPYLAEDPGVGLEQLLETAVLQLGLDVGVGVEAISIDLGCRDV